jgi:hypothetical protein
MQITIDIPDEFASDLQARGEDPQVYVQRLVMDPEHLKYAGMVRLGGGPHSPQEAGRIIRELRKNNSLGGLRVKDLIDEGRKY